MTKDRVLVEAYSDADFSSEKGDRKSVSGGVLMVAGIVKQIRVVLSTMEAEFVAASQTTAEVLGILELLQEISITPCAPSVPYVETQAAIAQIEGEDTSRRAKHIDVRSGKMEMLKAMRADILTKFLPVPRLSELRGLVMLKDTDGPPGKEC
ncbi:polyprotein [Phytophthora megakarya]|uniref:Polyprotein n=1 Tax=Phytophthora megakarya TaxID=4795 RepID=A0A225VP13_9STRA|nr:polyprotein [Phytophthora megakarya]